MPPSLLCYVGDCGKIVIFTIPYTALCFASLAIVAKLSFSPHLPNSPLRQLLWGPYTALCFASLAIVAKLSFSPHLPNSPLLPTFMGPYTALCFASLAIVAKLSFSPCLPNSPTFSHFCHFCCCVHFWTYLNLEGPESEAKGILGLCLTRWTVHASCFQRILDNYAALLQE